MQIIFILLLIILFPFRLTSAHEVYVLDPSEIKHDIGMPTPDFVATVTTHFAQFLEWGLIVIVLVGLIFMISVSRPIEKVLDKSLIKLKRYAPTITQITLGIGLLASGYFGAAFGIELSFATMGYMMLLKALFTIAGMMVLFGIYPRLGASITIGLFVPFLYKYGVYMLNYMTYFGEAIAILVFGSAYSILQNLKMKPFFEQKILRHLHTYKFLLLRIFFGISLIYASLYAKFFHGELALHTVTKYHLTMYFPFDPLFLVLGAMILEIILGLFFILGFEIRFASLFFLVFLSASLMFFGESVWPHIILFGTAIAMFTHGYDKYTLTAYLSRRKDLEPTL